MSELVPGEIIQKLERRHEELIGELDALNARLEEALNSFTRPADQEAEPEVVESPKAAQQQQGVSS